LTLAIAATANSEDEVGRYQLFMGEYSSMTIKGGEQREKALFKIDTKTGDVWIGRQSQTRYIQGESEGVVQVRTWYEFEQEMKIPKEIWNNIKN